jgi:hypothetical protein
MKNKLSAVIMILLAAFGVSLLLAGFLPSSPVNLGTITGSSYPCYQCSSLQQCSYFYLDAAGDTCCLKCIGGASTSIGPGSSLTTTTVKGSDQSCGCINNYCSAACHNAGGYCSSAGQCYATQYGTCGCVNGACSNECNNAGLSCTKTGDCNGQIPLVKTCADFGYYDCPCPNPYVSVGQFSPCLDNACTHRINCCQCGTKPSPTTCPCTDWTDNQCGASPCATNEMKQTRTCNPSGCDAESQCVASDICSSSGTAVLFYPIKDSTLRQDNPDKNYGVLQNMLVESNASQNARLVVQFDTSSIPPGAVVSKAVLNLSYNSIVGQDPVGRSYIAYGLSTAWKEYEVTWNNATATTAWSSAGGDTGAAVTSTHVPSTTSVNMSWRIDSLAQQWINSPSNNFGVLIKDSNEGASSGTGARFYTRESSILPNLEIDYTLPSLNCCCDDTLCGTNCVSTYLTCSQLSKTSCPASSCSSTPTTTTSTTSSTTTTTAIASSGFYCDNFACPAITGGFQCTCGYTNNLGESAKVSFMFALSGNDNDIHNPSINVYPTGTGTAYGLFYCNQNPTGTYYAHWYAYRQSDTTLSHVVNVSLINQQVAITCS